uniref:Uncharacterized protein n=1 Tax=Wuchereria bancrofti TaxID=6293 RepID=A0AAF5Q1A2_WUCBA
MKNIKQEMTSSFRPHQTKSDINVPQFPNFNQ